MNKPRTKASVFWSSRAALFGLLACLPGASGADATEELTKQVRELQKQNQLLQEQLRHQQELIDRMGQKLETLEKSSVAVTNETSAAPPLSDERKSGFALPVLSGNLIVSGEAGFTFLHPGSAAGEPKDQFDVDEARLFLDAKVWNDVYLFTELNVVQREGQDRYFQPGEIYADVEGLLKHWDQEKLLNIRVGRLYIPFGEEYLTRTALDNPLISHSLSDLWGYDEGVEAYGSLGKFRYVAAMQNGSPAPLRHYSVDKALAGRVSYDPTSWLHTSVSAMRTGNLSTQNQGISELWFGGGFIRALGASATTSNFHANLVEGDVQWLGKRHHLKAAGGYVHQDDNNVAVFGADKRDVYYYYLEGLQSITDRLYVAARASQIFAPGGAPLVGNGDFGSYFFRELSTDLWRVSLGVGYRWSSHCILKGEYSFNGGHESDGGPRTGEDLLGAELTVGF